MCSWIKKINVKEHYWMFKYSHILSQTINLFLFFGLDRFYVCVAEDVIPPQEMQI